MLKAVVDDNLANQICVSIIKYDMHAVIGSGIHLHISAIMSIGPERLVA
jgi:hypothetical protein